MSPLLPGSRWTARTARGALLLALLLALPITGLPGGHSPLVASEPEGAEAPPATQVRARPRWSEETIRLAESIPVQAGGRIKPLITYAGYTLLSLTGRKSVKVVEAGEERSLGPTEWMLDVLFFPHVAVHYRLFLVTDDAALDAIGFTAAMREQAAKADYEREGAGHATRKKRDRWSYADLAPAFTGLQQRAKVLRDVPAAERTRVQQQVLGLYEAVALYSELASTFQLATGRIELPKAKAVAALWGDAPSARFTDVARRLEPLLAALPGHGAGKADDEQRAIAGVVFDLERLAGGERGPALLPPPPGDPEQAWDTPYTALARAVEAGEPMPEGTLRLLEGFEHVGDALGKPGATEAAVRSLQQDLVRAAEARGEYERVALEVTYQRLDPVHVAWILSMLGLAFALLGLLSLAGRFGWWMRAFAWVLLVGAATVLVGGIVMRCVIRERPPVSTLYETVLFIAATAMLVSLVVEGAFRRRLGLPIAGVVGTLGLLLAQWFESLNKQDTMPTLEAVLDTNFWLATHVTTVTFGYSAGLLAALLGQVYVLGKVLGIGKQATAGYAALGRTVYGVICFGLLLSLVGTILGGIWANDSWGRFWGWDPKENGALMIVLWELMMLHARMGGYVGPFGFSMLAVGGGCVVAWSWWGVNQLGVGLHSYGFTEGIQTMLNSIYLWLGGVILAGGAWLLVRRLRAARP
jgi:ABC-type transport system involved in cytochrome c biogenesis permease subunit